MEGSTKIYVTFKRHNFVAIVTTAKGPFPLNQNNYQKLCLIDELIRKKKVLRTCSVYL